MWGIKGIVRVAATAAAVVPLAFVARVGSGVRGDYGGTESFEPTAAQEAAIEAYIGPVRAVERSTRRADDLGGDFEPTEEDAARALEVAGIWMEGSQRGELRDLESTYYGDTCAIGVKGQIMDARDALIEHLLACADSPVIPSDLIRARCALAALRVAAIAKYSDFGSVTSSVAKQDRSLRRVARCLATGAPRIRELVLPQLRLALAEVRPMIHLLSRQWVLLNFASERLSLTNPGPTNHEKLPILRRIVGYTSATSEASTLARQVLKQMHGEAGALVAMIRVAWSKDVQFAGDLEELIGILAHHARARNPALVDRERGPSL
jgi:hypothetical protein